MSNIKYDENGGIVSLEADKLADLSSSKSRKNKYSFLEKWMIERSKKLNYLLDEQGKYKCRLEKKPQVIRIGPTNLCTAQCTYCPREHIHAGGRGYMDFGLFERIVAWAKEKGVRDMSFALFGEPLLHPQIFDMLSLAKQNGLRIGISTNAIILNKKFVQQLIDLDLDAIEMSLDGCNRPEYLAGKRVDKYETAKENIEYLLEIAKKHHSKSKFNIHFVDSGNVSRQNKRKFVSYWKEKLQGLDYVTSFYYEPHNWAGTRPDARQYNSWFDNLLAKFELKKPCIYIKGLNVDWNGNVIICTNDPTGKAVIGNVNHSDLEKIYNGEKRMKYLTVHEMGDFREFNCGVCTVNSYWPLLFLKKRILNYFSK